MPTFNIQENAINQNYLLNLKTVLNTENSWVRYDNVKCDFSSQREHSTVLTSTIQNCTHMVNKFFSTIYLDNEDRKILPDTYYLINSKWIGGVPKNNNNKWIMKDVWDYSDNNSQLYNNIEECISLALMDKYYVVQNYIPNLNLVRCYVILYRNQHGTEFHLFKDGYYSYDDNDNKYERFKLHSNYDSIYSKIKNTIQVHLSSLSKSLNKKTETQLQEFQVFEYLFGIEDINCYLLNCSIQLSIYEKENKVFNILSNIITNDIVTGLINPVLSYNENGVNDVVDNLVNQTVESFIDKSTIEVEEISEKADNDVVVDDVVVDDVVVDDENKEDSVEKEVPQIINMDPTRWDKLELDKEEKEISSIFLDVIESSKKKIYKLKNAQINTYSFENTNSNNILMGINKILEGLGDWKESKKDIGFSDSNKSVVRYGLNMSNSINMSNVTSLVSNKYAPEIYTIFNTVPKTNEKGIWFVKNLNTNELNIVDSLQDENNTELNIKDDFVLVDKEDIIIYQKEIDNLMLINNRKFIIKTYCLLSGNMDESGDISKIVNNVLLNIEGIMFCASEDYDKTSTNRKVHSFTEHNPKNSDISNYALHFSDWNYYDKIYPVICKILTKFFKKLFENQSLDDMSLQLLEFDFMIDNNNKVYLVDIQENPIIMADKRMWYSSVKTVLTSMLKDVVDMVVIPYLNEDSIEITSRWKKII